MASKFPYVWAFVLFLYLVVLLGPKDPPSAPALASHYEAPLAADYDAPPYPDDPAPALTYETFPWPPLPDDYPPGGCPIARAAVTAQGVGE